MIESTMCSKEPTVTIPLSKYDLLFRQSEMCDTLITAIAGALTANSYGPSLDDRAVIDVFKALRPELYESWEAAQEAAGKLREAE